MTKTGVITMSMREVDRLKTIQAVVDRNLKPMIAATHAEHRRPFIGYQEGSAKACNDRNFAMKNILKIVLNSLALYSVTRYTPNHENFL